MSDYASIADITRSLRELLRTYITLSTLPQIAGVPIDLRSPKEMREASAQGVSLWLYRIIRNSDLLNRPRVRSSATQIERPSMPINLHYLITPLAANPVDEQALMGRVLQVLNDHASLGGANLLGTLENSGEEFRLNFEPMTLEDITRVWNSLQEPYQLSVSFEVVLITIDSLREPDQGSPVLVKETEYMQILDRS
jgi:hypothetical protein